MECAAGMTRRLQTTLSWCLVIQEVELDRLNSLLLLLVSSPPPAPLVIKVGVASYTT